MISTFLIAVWDNGNEQLVISCHCWDNLNTDVFLFLFFFPYCGGPWNDISSIRLMLMSCYLFGCEIVSSWHSFFGVMETLHFTAHSLTQRLLFGLWSPFAWKWSTFHNASWEIKDKSLGNLCVKWTYLNIFRDSSHSSTCSTVEKHDLQRLEWRFPFSLSEVEKTCCKNN